MKNWRTFGLVIITIFIFWLLKFYLGFPSTDIEIVSAILTVVSVLFGFLAGFFISELWSRYTEIRELQSTRCSDGLNMITYAEYFYRNKKFEKEFKTLVEISAVADEIVEWDEGHLEIPYYRNIENSFRHIKVKDKKEEIYFDNLLESYHRFIEAAVRLDALGKEKLFLSEWLILISLSFLISISVLFLDVSHFFYQIIVFIYPSIIIMTLSIIYDLNTLLWSKETVSLEPNQQIFDAMGMKRFYQKSKKKFVSKHVKDYRTEDDLKGDLKKVYMKIIKQTKP